MNNGEQAYRRDFFYKHLSPLFWENTSKRDDELFLKHQSFPCLKITVTYVKIYR